MRGNRAERLDGAADESRLPRDVEDGVPALVEDVRIGVGIFAIGPYEGGTGRDVASFAAGEAGDVVLAGERGFGDLAPEP